MMRSLFIGLLLLSGYVRAESAYTIFVPEAKGVPGNYHDRDIRKAFPSLSKSDTKLSVCTNRMMSGASAITYFGDTTDHEVVLKTSSCKAVAHGLLCANIEQSKAFYFERPVQHFATLDGVSYEDAARVISAYKANGIINAPDYLQKGWNYRHVRYVARAANGFKLILGDFLCAGCVAKVEVNFDERGNLVLGQVLDASCI